MKKGFGLLLTGILAFSLSACGEKVETKPAGSKEKGKEKTEQISIVTGGTGGTYYPLGGEMAKIIKDNAGYETSSQASGASVENMTLIQDGEANLAFTQTDIASYATEGQEMFKDGKLDKIQAIGTLYPETVQIVALKDSGIKSVDDLKGKKVSVGAPGSGTYANAEQILKVHGITMDDIKAQHLSFDESAEGIQDGNIDAAFITAGTPTGAVEALSASKGVTILPIAADKIKALMEEHKFYIEDTIASGTYKLESEVKTVAVLSMLVASKDLSEETVYEITKAIFENTDKITHAKGKLIKGENALNGVGIELHPGAKKYFDEKGIK
ncbi:TAXI family TRAP transporter solute-binding subunit [Fictibacillus aquaticus]|uniref:C4-dicarboxylate ABC transporter substrate-binding protein n=1 Tax=Fictibacillus aquaticus TaxID=2021314 RepID=A0A235FDZ2_9BACL|nr:TAXI family TRAP transporter solute-binding subunit [Fictibacillus aquaticus]OYD59568.1 C4-dicarboxylate ABC transporter substrate-binding protein [Fictibacillus aquaticus]